MSRRAQAGRRRGAIRRVAIRRVAILGRASRSGVDRGLASLERWLDRLGLDVVRLTSKEAASGSGWLPDAAAARLARSAGLLITLGGDGTILAAARMVAGTKVPILPINLGGLGFLASFEEGELRDAVRAALAGELAVEPRRLLTARVEPAGGGSPIALGLALNDVVLKPEATYRALRLEVRAGDTFLGHVVADGLIAASPSGSTAYSLSAGGPVIAPGLDALVVTPVCPHTLGMRALVLPPTVEVLVRVRSRDRSGAIVSLDGLDGVAIRPNDSVRVALAKGAVRFLRSARHALPVALPHKLGWSGSPRRSRG